VVHHVEDNQEDLLNFYFQNWLKISSLSMKAKNRIKKLTFLFVIKKFTRSLTKVIKEKQDGQ
jgi:hypothetical protein